MGSPAPSSTSSPSIPPSSSSSSTSTSASSSSSSSSSAPAGSSPFSPIHIYSREELLARFMELCPVPVEDRPGVGRRRVVGLVGYPNVGKSSTINVLVGEKKVAVAPTPGKTKHFQTIFMGDELCLCDCPGLVFPTIMGTKADMVVNGLLPIDQMRDHIEPIRIVCQRIPKHILEKEYGIVFPPPAENEDPNRDPTAHELLGAYGYKRGYMAAHGNPDMPRTARYVLKDFVSGRLLYCCAPPGTDEKEFQAKRMHVNTAALRQDAERSGDGASDDDSAPVSNDVEDDEAGAGPSTKKKSKKKKRAQAKSQAHADLMSSSSPSSASSVPVAAAPAPVPTKTGKVFKQSTYHEDYDTYLTKQADVKYKSKGKSGDTFTTRQTHKYFAPIPIAQVKQIRSARSTPLSSAVQSRSTSPTRDAAHE
eukprot:TRINITY_DN6835_c1_g1_i2.p1 TRINITY_DN6835_c1_g1~~TRINITY_DN6835_c1_g1_i2.p1  ORF type:complete len:438 (-),score=115.96 TRINITY_DN6835_c1_g1_i2:64-1326(-)